jgi:LmbE family N-acetylglucosaminyl deacetylase
MALIDRHRHAGSFAAVRTPIAGLALAAAVALASAAGHALGAQQARAAELYRLVQSLTVTPRVLVIGVHPEDADEQLLVWLARGRHIETAYLSLTRGESGDNFGGQESGASLAAIRTQEVLAARRIDGAQQYFTRAMDFGFARNAAEVFTRWDRDSIVADVVTVIRAFRPQVIVAAFNDSLRDGDGQHQALGAIVGDAIAGAANTRRFSGIDYGPPWSATKLYREAPGITIETGEYDPLEGRTYTAIATEALAQNRTQGLSSLVSRRATAVQLQRAWPANSGAPDQSLFDGVDTTFARFAPHARNGVDLLLPQLALYADSARRALDVQNPERVVPYLARVATLANSVRTAAAACFHSAATARPSVTPDPVCDQHALDLDAAIDLVQQRSTHALLLAAGVTFEATADRELVALKDSGVVTVAIHNHGSLPVTLADVDVYGNHAAPMRPMVVPPDSSAEVVRTISELETPHPWWLGKRSANRYAPVVSTLDGISRMLIPAPLAMRGVAVPETIRRTSDAGVTVTVAGATVRTSLGPVVYPYADARVGLQERPIAGVPDVTLKFERPLEWIQRGKPISRALRVKVKSFSDEPQTITLRPFPMKGMRIDSLQTRLTLAPREQTELFLQVRGKVDTTAREAFGLIGTQQGPPDAKGARSFNAYQSGFSSIERDYLTPIRLFGQSGTWIQPIDIEVPPTLTVLYVPGLGDETAAALKQIGIFVASVEDADQLLSVDLTKVAAIVIGPRAFEAHPDLLGQTERFLDFARRGGTLVVMRGDAATVGSHLFPFPITLARPQPERVTMADAPVTVLDPAARVLEWPNTIREADWKDWVSERARYVPSSADPRYTRVIEMHDPGEKENRNTILTTRVGKGTLIYTTLTLEQQIAGGVPGALRLLVNLLSAGLPGAPAAHR